MGRSLHNGRGGGQKLWKHEVDRWNFPPRKKSLSLHFSREKKPCPVIFSSKNRQPRHFPVKKVFATLFKLGQKYSLDYAKRVLWLCTMVGRHMVDNIYAYDMFCTLRRRSSKKVANVILAKSLCPVVFSSKSNGPAIFILLERDKWIHQVFCVYYK